jgi:kynurenine formamidase
VAVDSLGEFRRVAGQVRNWERWEAQDELGTLNLIDDDKVRQAAGLVTKGKVFPLGLDFGSSSPQGALEFRQRPVHLMLGEFWYLDVLAADCAADGQYAFQVVAPPLRVTGAVGSPVNPIVLK